MAVGGASRHRWLRTVATSVLAAALAAGVTTAASAAAVPSGAGPTTADPADARTDNVVLRWNAAALQGVRDSTLGPPMVARALGVLNTCVYDAWAAYDPTADGTRLGGQLRRPAPERILANKNKAVSFAAYRAAVDLFPWDTAVFDDLMGQLGYDPADLTADRTTPAGVGNVACGAVLDFRHADGSNQLGDLHPGSYSDYTGYQPANDPMVAAAPFDPVTVHDPSRWQPLTFVNPAGQTVTPGYVGPHWGLVTPFSLSDGAALRSTNPPARFGTAAYLKQARDLVTLSANLTDRQKVIAENWQLGPGSNQPPGQWVDLASFVSRRDHNSLDRDVKMFFLVGNAELDAGIASWDDKRAFDSVRPITAVRVLFNGTPIRAWGGPGQGTRTIDGGTWQPYQPASFPTPPFAEYVSGHSTFSAAAAEVLRRFTGSDRFGASVTVPAGASRFEPGVTPAADVTLSWSTFSVAADEAGMSRRYGGIHFEQGDLDGRALGRAVGGSVWNRSQPLFQGSEDPNA